MPNRTWKTALAVAWFAMAGCGIFGGDDDPEPAKAPEPLPGEPPLPPGSVPPAPGTPKTEELTEEFGVFVASHGSANGDGSRARPFASIAQAIATADGKKRVYVCAGTYREAIAIVNNVTMLGGLDCATEIWASRGARSRLEAPTSPSVRAEGIVNTTRFEGFEAVAPDGTAEAPSSIALLAKGSPKLTIANARLAAGRGKDGAPGTDGVQLTIDSTAGENYPPGNGPLAQAQVSTTYPQGGAGGTATCAGEDGHNPEKGGNGGRGGVYRCKQLTDPISGNTLYRWQWEQTTFGAQKPLTVGEVKSGAPGDPGTDGVSAAAIGLLSADGYVPADGTPGSSGKPGRGGRGGDPQSGVLNTNCGAPNNELVYYGIGGGGGGAGGCPGLAGTAGKGGGASIAALVVASPGLAFEATELAGGDGGAGGKGTLGSVPTVGSAAGTNGPLVTPAPTAGGVGGRAGYSGSGAGGPSIALAYSAGDVDVRATSKLVVGKGGAAAPEEQRTDGLGNTVTLPASAAGLAAAKHAF